MKTVPLWLLLCWPLLGAWNAKQTVAQLQFTVTYNNDSVGTLSIERTVREPEIVYTLRSSVAVSFLFAVQVEEEITDIFDGGGLQRSSHQRYINGTRKAHHSIARQQTGYEAVDQRHELKKLKDPILATVVSIYFEEPRQAQWVYSQNFQKMVYMEKKGLHCYQIDLPNGTSSRYHYQDGALRLVETDTHLGTLRFTRNIREAEYD